MLRRCKLRQCQQLTKKHQQCRLCVGPAGSGNACWRHKHLLLHDAVYGLFSITVLTSVKYKQTIIVLGENHRASTANECKEQVNVEQKISASNYTLSLLELSDAFFDFYMEISPEKMKESQWEPWAVEMKHLSELRAAFKDCFHEEKKCPYRNIRVHGVDVRAPSLKSMVRFLDTLLKKIQNGAALSTLKKFWIQGKSLMAPLTETKSQEYEYLVNRLFDLNDDSRLWKEIDRIDPDFESDFRRVMERTLDDVRLAVFTFYDKRTLPLLEELDRIFLEEKKLKLRQLQTKLEKYVDDLLLETAPILDLYALSRMFHKFRLTPQERRRQVPEYPKNIILYVGQKHAENIVRILQSSNQYETKYSVLGGDAACVVAPRNSFLTSLLQE